MGIISIRKPCSNQELWLVFGLEPLFGPSAGRWAISGVLALDGSHLASKLRGFGTGGAQ